MNTRTAAIILGIIFIIGGLIGFVDNPIAFDSDTAIFRVNTAHNVVHLVSGLFLLAGAFTALGSANSLRILGIVYVLVAILGFLSADSLLGFITNSPADNWLHVAFAVILLIAGFLL
jgi:uncharacterized ion transporter superfamily protein YfcC